MHKLHIYTRSFINDNGVWDLSEQCINSVKELLSKSDSVDWTVLVSNVKDINDITKRLNVISEFGKYKINSLIYIDRLSCSQARYRLFEAFIGKDDQEPIAHAWLNDYFMNLDSDDYLNDIDKIAEFSKKISEFNSDLIGFGIDVPETSPLWEQWDWDLDKFKAHRRYITTETQTMFLFMHKFNVISYLMDKGTYFSSLIKPADDPNESCDDTLASITVAHHNFIHENNKFTISAICMNPIHYIEREGSVGKNQESKYKEKINKLLFALGYLYVNDSFYKFDERNNLIKYNPYE